MNWLLFGQIVALMFLGALFFNTVANHMRTHAADQQMRINDQEYNLDRQFYKETGEMRG